MILQKAHCDKLSLVLAFASNKNMTSDFDYTYFIDKETKVQHPKADNKVRQSCQLKQGEAFRPLVCFSDIYPDRSSPQIIWPCAACLSTNAVQFKCHFLETTCPSQGIVLDTIGNPHLTHSLFLESFEISWAPNQTNWIRITGDGAFLLKKKSL